MLKKFVTETPGLEGKISPKARNLGRDKYHRLMTDKSTSYHETVEHDAKVLISPPVSNAAVNTVPSKYRISLPNTSDKSISFVDKPERALNKKHNSSIIRESRKIRHFVFLAAVKNVKDKTTRDSAVVTDQDMPIRIGMPKCCALIKRKWLHFFGRKAGNQSNVKLPLQEESSSSDSERSIVLQNSRGAPSSETLRARSEMEISIRKRMGFPEKVLIECRLLHYVVRIKDRKKLIRFYVNILGMQIWRHEEFEDSYEDYDGVHVQKWSRTMVGYGPEDTHFALQLTYDYKAVKFVPDCSLRSVTVRNSDTFVAAQQHYWIVQPGNYLNDPNGYSFHIKESTDGKAQFDKITLVCADLQRALRYWNGMLEMNVFKKTDDSLCLAYRAGQIRLELKRINNILEKDCRPGRIVFECPKNQQEVIEQRIMDNNYTILSPLQTVSIPGHQPMRIMVLEDPDGHEVAFVDDDNYKLISQPIPGSEGLLRQQLELES